MSEALAGSDAGRLPADAAPHSPQDDARKPGREGADAGASRATSSARASPRSPSGSTGSRACSRGSASSRASASATFAWNNQRHFELYFAIPCVGAVLHTLNIRLFEEQLTLHRQPRRGPGDLRRRLAGAECWRSSRRRLRAVEHYVVMGDGDAGSLPNVLRYEELIEQAGDGRLRLPRARRAPGGGALLHERHDRQPEGRALLAPLDQPALDGDARQGRPRAVAQRPRARGGADVPRQRLGAAARRGARGSRPDAARPIPRRRAAGRPDRGRAPDADGLRADDLRRPAALRRRARRGRPVVADERDVRRLGGAAPADAATSRSATA